MEPTASHTPIPQGWNKQHGHVPWSVAALLQGEQRAISYARLMTKDAGDSIAIDATIN